MNEFFMTLPSYKRTEFPKNQPHSFKVRLPDHLPFEYDSDEWSVGLSSISLPDAKVDLKPLVGAHKGVGDDTLLMATWKYVQKGSTRQNKAGTGTVRVKDIADQPNIVDGVTLIMTLFNLLDQKRVQSLPQNTEQNETDYPDYTWKTNAGEQELTLLSSGEMDVRAKLFIHVTLATKMGWIVHDGSTYSLGPNLLMEWKTGGRPQSGVAFTVADDMLELSNGCEWRVGNINNAFRSVIGNPNRIFHVYSNIGKSTIVGDQITDLLREIRYVREGKGINYFEPLHIHYHEVRNKNVEIIEIQISETDGTLVDFGHGETTVTLRFKKG